MRPLHLALALVLVAFAVVASGLMMLSASAAGKPPDSQEFPASHVYVLCKYDTQYIVVVPRGAAQGVAITVAYDHDGRPAKCKD